MENTIPEQVPTSSIPDFKQACNFLRADILAIDKEVTALKGHEKVAVLGGNDKGEVLANLMLAHRHLEDARMRLGKAIQHSESRESIFDIKQNPEELGKLAHKRFLLSLGGDVDPSHEWEGLPENERAAWIAAGSVGEPIAQ